MISIKINSKSFDNIISNLNILIIKYAEKGNIPHNAIVFVPPKAFKVLKKFSDNMGDSILCNGIKLAEDKNIKDELIIIDKEFFNLTPTYNNEVLFI